jgi:hypothetical protein
MRGAEERLRQSSTDYAGMQTQGGPTGGVDAFLALTLRNVMGSLSDLEQLGRALSGTSADRHACQILNCPRGAQLLEAVRETVRVLEATKGTFKSKQVGELRHSWERLLDHH